MHGNLESIIFVLHVFHKKTNQNVNDVNLNICPSFDHKKEPIKMCE